jgi:hypothetical protein
MLILHVASSNQHDGVAFIWAEVGGQDGPPGTRQSRWGWRAGAREHPGQAGRDRLRSVLPEPVLRLGSWRWRTAWLPSDAAGPLPSEERIAPLAGRCAERLAPWGVQVLMVSAGGVHELYQAARGEARPEWEFGAEGGFWQRAQELAGALVVRQQFLPGLIEAGGEWFGEWYPVYEAADRERIAQLAQAMPVAARALNSDPRRPPADRPHGVVHSVIQRLVGSLVKRAQVESALGRRLPAAAGRRAAPSLHDRWVEALLVAGTEIRGGRRELVGLANETGAWREAVGRLPRLERGEDAPAICLPAGGTSFWAGGQLPEPLACPETPRQPAAILDRVGDLPDWRASRRLRDSLLPVYEAASRYALASVFGRKPEARLDRSD